MKSHLCDQCQKHVDDWTAYYWFSSTKKWLCLNCIYKKPSSAKSAEQKKEGKE